MRFNNWVKYIFFIIILILLICGVCLIYGKKKEQIITVVSNEKGKNISYDFTIGITNYDTLNPILTNSKDCDYISKILYRNLLNIDEEFNIVSDIAKEYSKLNDTSYIIKLNNDVEWSDGSILTSDDIKFTIDNLKKINNSQFFKNVENIKEVIILDNFTLKILLVSKDDDFFYKLCIPILAKNKYDENTLISNTDLPVVNGKYKFKVENNDEIILISDNSKSITLKIYSSVTELYTAFVKKNVDFIYTENIDYENYIGKIGYNVDISSGRKYGYIIFNINRVEENIRTALSYGINKQNIIYDVFNNKYKECNGIFEYKGLYSENNDLYNYNSNECIKILNGNTVNLNLLVQKDNKKLIEVANEIKNQLEDKGIIINIIKYRKEDLNYLISLNNFDLILLEDELSLDYNIEKFMEINNFSNYDNNEVKYLITEMKNIKDKEIFIEKYKKLLTYYEKDLPFISLYYGCNIVLANSNLNGNFKHNWYNLFYNVERWYLIKN